MGIPAPGPETPEQTDERRKRILELSNKLISAMEGYDTTLCLTAIDMAKSEVIESFVLNGGIGDTNSIRETLQNSFMIMMRYFENKGYNLDAKKERWK